MPTAIEMTQKQLRFVELERQKAGYYKFLGELEQATKDVAEELGIGAFFQDDQGIVYQIVIPNGEFVRHRAVGYLRTKRKGEAKGTLSMDVAKEAGFEV